MKVSLLFPTLLVALLVSSVSAEVAVERRTLVDEAREREVPLKFYIPQADAAVPVVLLSHGLGGSNDAMTYLAQTLAESGYLVVALQHAGSDEAVWRDARPADRMAALKEAANGRNAIARAADVSFVLGALLADDRPEALSFVPSVDPDAIAVAGHSFGAHTAMMTVGMSFANGTAAGLDPRVRAAIALSPPAGREQFDGVAVPVLHLTGTNDRSPLNANATPERRQRPYRAIDAPGGVLIVFRGGTHGVFNGPGPALPGETIDAERDERIRSLTAEACRLFLDARLRGDAEAVERLKTFEERLGDAGTVQQNAP